MPKKEDVKVVRLNAASKMALSKALRGLEPGQKGWISFDDAARLFSPSTKNPKEWDEARIKALTDFAAEIEHRPAPNGTRAMSASISLEYGRSLSSHRVIDEECKSHSLPVRFPPCWLEP